MINTGALRIPRSQALSRSAVAAQNAARDSAVPTTSSETPWVNPADGARNAAAHTASTSVRRHRTARVVRPHHPPSAERLSHLHRYQDPPNAASALSFSAWLSTARSTPSVSAMNRAVCGIR